MQRNTPAIPPRLIALVLASAGCNGFVVSLGSETEEGGTHTVADVGARDSGAAKGDGGVDASPSDGGVPPLADAGNPGSEAGGPGSDASPPVCPAAPPVVGATCKDLGEECEYGASATTACNKVYKCESTGWRTEAPSGACPVSTCPASYGMVDVAATCAPSGATCAYAEGTCTCAPPSPATVPSEPDQWQCFPAQTGCPSPRPKLGSACATSTATSCNYGACADGVELVCRGGIWVSKSVACPT